RSAANAGHGALAVKPEKQLISHHSTTADEAESVKSRMRADRRSQRGNMQRLGPFADHFDVVDMSAIAGKTFQPGIDLIIDRGGTFVALDQHDAGAVIDCDQRTREDRRRLVGSNK